MTVAQRLREKLRQGLDAELPLVGIDLTSVLLVQALVLLGGHGVVQQPHVAVLLDVTLAGVPGFEGRAGGERVRVGLGDLGPGHLRGIDGDGQRRVDVRGRQEGLVLWVEVDRLEGGWGLAVGVLQHGVAFVVVSCSCV